MGLDLIVEGCPKPGHEREWRQLLQRSFGEEELSDQEVSRFQELSIPAFANIGAPRVGSDEAANQWILKARGAKTPEESAAVLKEFDGYYAVRLVPCDGVPKFSQGDLYEGADDTSFRGSFLEGCQDVLSRDLLKAAWEHKFPEQAIAYGRALLAAADTGEAAAIIPKPRRTFFSRLGLTKSSEPVPMKEQLEIVRAAGRWFIFWGQHGHAIRAWF